MIKARWYDSMKACSSYSDIPVIHSPMQRYVTPSTLTDVIGTEQGFKDCCLKWILLRLCFICWWTLVYWSPTACHRDSNMLTSTVASLGIGNTEQRSCKISQLCNYQHFPSTSLFFMLTLINPFSGGSGLEHPESGSPVKTSSSLLASSSFIQGAPLKSKNMLVTMYLQHWCHSIPMAECQKL